MISLWLRWDAPARSMGWAVVEAAHTWSASAEMSWRRRIHPGWNHLAWPDLWSLPAEERVKLRLAAALTAALVVIAWGTPTAEALRGYYQARNGADWRTVASVLDRLIPEGDHVVATVGAVYPLRHYWSLRVEEMASVGFPRSPNLDGKRWWVVTHEGRDRPPDLAAWLATHAVKVGEVPTSWSLPGLEIYRLRSHR